MKTITKVKYPEKTSINLVMRDGAQENTKITLIGFSIFLILLLIFVKFAVLNPMAKASERENNYNTLQKQLDDMNGELKDYNSVSEEYSHYSNGYMNEEELLITDRLDALSLLDDCVLNLAEVQSVDITSNNMTIVLSETSLATVSNVVAALQKDERTSYVTVSTAAADNATENSQLVTANIIVELVGTVDTTATQETTEAGGEAS